MRNYDIGVLPSSQEYFYLASSFAKKTLFYLESGGDYQCDRNYIVNKMEEPLDTYLLRIVQEGTLYLEVEEKSYTIPTGGVYLLDCKKPHKYYAKDNVSFQYFHFSGIAVQNYVDLLEESNGPVFFPEDFVKISRMFHAIISMLEKGDVNEHIAALKIQEILTELSFSNKEHFVDTNQIILDAAQYIEKFYSENLSIKSLAKTSNLSIYYFIRTFKKIHGSTPYDYLLQVRLKNGKKLLLNTGLSIENISEIIGFSGVSNFIRTFRKETGLTPTQYRKRNKE